MSNGAGAPAVMWVVSFRREDAIAYDPVNEIFTFETGMEKINVYKTTLVSLEFPMTQRTIEADFSRFGYSEGLMLGPETRTLAMRELVPALGSDVFVDATLPMSATYVNVVSGGATNLVTIETLSDDLTTPVPHGLFVGPPDGTGQPSCIADLWAELMGEPLLLVLENVPLPPPQQRSVSMTCANLTYVSESRFVIDTTTAGTTPDSTTGFLYAPAIRTPVEAAALLQWVVAQYPTVNNYDVTFDAPTMRTTVAARGAVEPGTQLYLTAGHCGGLLPWLGWPCDVECTAAGDYRQGVGWLGAAQTPGCWPCDRPTLANRGDRQTLACRDRGLEEAGLSQVAIPLQGFRADFPPALGAGPPVTVLRRECDRYMQLACESQPWCPCGQVRVNPGWYTPVTRPSGVAEPLSGELEMRMSPFRFAPPAANQQMQAGLTSIYRFVVETPLGQLLIVPVEMGQYTPYTLAETIEANVHTVAAASAPPGWSSFSATFHPESNQFIFADLQQRPFSLQFSSPYMFEPRRIGFQSKRYFGSFAYASDEMTLPRRSVRGEESPCPVVSGKLSKAPGALMAGLPSPPTVVSAQPGHYTVPLSGGSGTGGTVYLDLETVDGAVTIVQITVSLSGHNYQAGDVVTVAAGLLNADNAPPPASAVVSITLTDQMLTSHTNPCCPSSDPALSEEPNALLSSITTTLATATVAVYDPVSVATVSGTGSGLQVRVEIQAGPVIYEITVVDPGQGYAVGDVLSIASGDLGVGSTELSLRLNAYDFVRQASYACCLGWPLNWYSVNDGGATRKFNLVGTPPHTVYVTCAGCPGGCANIEPPFPTTNTMQLQTALRLMDDTPAVVSIPFATPYQKWDVVVLSNLNTGLQYNGLVLEDAGRSGVDSNGDTIKLLSLYVPGVDQSDIGCSWDTPSVNDVWTVQAAPSYSPFSMAIPSRDDGCCPGHPIPTRVLGLPEGATLWQIDHDNTIVAPNVMDLEHVDYILMDLGWDFMRKTDTFQLAGRHNNSVGFAKLVLYPQYQVHGLLPRDLVTTSMDSPVRFQVRFQNPDLTPYRLNGRQFSFSLQLVSPQGTM